MHVATEGSATVKEATAPEPDDPRKPSSPTDLPKRSWLYTARLAIAEFRRDQCLDLSAALTFYTVGAVFPALIVAAALIGLIGDPSTTSETIDELLVDLGQRDVAERLREPIAELASSQAAGLALAVGLLAALWSASAYVGAFGRAMNRIYEIDEGRPAWKLRPINLAVTVVMIVGAAFLLFGVAASGTLARELGDRFGVSDGAVTVWGYAKWPVMLFVLSLLVSVLYYATPNVQQPKFRWVSIGAGMAMVMWIVGSLGFGLYVQNFGSYDRTYGSLAGVIVMLLWLWVTNTALLFGAEFDSELERARQLEAGIEAEETLQLPPRDTRVSDKAAAKLAADIAAGRELRKRAERRQLETTARRHAERDREAPAVDDRRMRLSHVAVLVAMFLLGRTGLFARRG